ncbi:hypothetical protein JCM19238_3495 [Vibrio ponticus]|nr:hypothetical protein JCM19238_3495 [Vibrio ponticus]
MLCTLASSLTTASDNPLASVNKLRFMPYFALFVGFFPVF